MVEPKGRIYSGLGEAWSDLRTIVSQRALVRSTMRGGLDPAFRERLMLVVTAVNGCPYCSYAHARQALSAGISMEEIEMLGEMILQGSPAEEVPALLYAQHWAETNARPEPAVRASVADRYGEEVLDRIEVVLHAIRIGNLLGNTFDYVLHRLSFGRVGGDRAHAEP